MDENPKVPPSRAACITYIHGRLQVRGTQGSQSTAITHSTLSCIQAMGYGNMDYGRGLKHKNASLSPGSTMG